MWVKMQLIHPTTFQTQTFPEVTLNSTLFAATHTAARCLVTNVQRFTFPLFLFYVLNTELMTTELGNVTTAIVWLYFHWVPHTPTNDLQWVLLTRIHILVSHVHVRRHGSISGGVGFLQAVWKILLVLWLRGVFVFNFSVFCFLSFWCIFLLFYIFFVRTIFQ